MTVTDVSDLEDFSCTDCACVSEYLATGFARERMEEEFERAGLAAFTAFIFRLETLADDIARLIRTCSGVTNHFFSVLMVKEIMAGGNVTVNVAIMSSENRKAERSFTIEPSKKS